MAVTSCESRSTKYKDHAGDFVNRRFACIDSDMKYYQSCLAGLSKFEQSDPVEFEIAMTFKIAKSMLEVRGKIDTPAKRRSVSQEMIEILYNPRVQNSELVLSDRNLKKVFTECLSKFEPTLNNGKRSWFKNSALKHYDGFSVTEWDIKIAYCFLTNQWVRDYVKAVPIVPKGLNPRTLETLFGIDEQYMRESPRNVLLLQQYVANGLRQGWIAIVPLPDTLGEGYRWRCILVDPSKHDRIMYEERHPITFEVMPERRIYWRDLHNKELVFRNNERPARRFLYLRFIITLLQASVDGLGNMVKALGLDNGKRSSWARPGYLIRRSSLLAITKVVSGLTLPESLVIDITDEDDNVEAPDSTAVFSAAVDMKAVLELLKHRI